MIQFIVCVSLVVVYKVKETRLALLCYAMLCFSSFLLLRRSLLCYAMLCCEIDSILLESCYATIILSTREIEIEITNGAVYVTSNTEQLVVVQFIQLICA